MVDLRCDGGGWRIGSPSVRGITVIEILVGSACTAFLVCILCATGFCLRPTNGDSISMANLMEVGTAHALYSWDWGGLQWCGHNSDYGLALGNCTTYLDTIGCPRQPILGWTASGSYYGYWITGGLCAAFPSGGCYNWVTTVPNEFATTNGVFGAWRLMQTRSFRNYLNGRFYDEVFYAPNDARTYASASRNFQSSAEFASTPMPVVWSSYGVSPAAMWHPDVLRSSEDGGFQSPSTFPEAFERQALFNAAYPELKSLVFEVNWNQQPPSSGQSLGSSVTPYRFNQGAASRPITLFYDGHVWYLSNKQAINDDARLVGQGGSGLWSRDTPLGTNGYYADTSVDSSRTNHSVLTTDGILGRDLLVAP